MTDTQQYPNVRIARHAAKNASGKVAFFAADIAGHLAGRAGLTKEQQTDNLKAALAHVEEIEAGVADLKASLSAAVEIAEQRDFEAHQIAKEAARAEGFESAYVKEQVESGVNDAEAFANAGGEVGVALQTEDLAAPKGEASDAENKEPVAEVADDE